MCSNSLFRGLKIHLGNLLSLSTTAAAKSLQSCLTLCDPIDGSPPGSKNTGVGCHFLLQSMKVKSESKVALSCPTPSDPVDCSLRGSSIHGIFQARVLEWGAIAFSSLVVQGTLKSLLQHHSLKASILWHSAFFMVQLSQLYIIATIVLTIWIFVSKVMSLLFNTLSRFVIPVVQIEK